ncbi:transposase [Streptomyces sp. 900105245]
MSRIVERLVPDELWELFQRVVPEAPSRPQGGGRRRHGDREVLAAIVFVATPGCTWQEWPAASFGPSGATAHRRFTEWTKARVWAKLHRLVLDELGFRGDLDWSRCAIDSVNMRALKGGPDRSESGGSGQVRLKDPPDHRADRSAPVCRHLRRQRSRQRG